MSTFQLNRISTIRLTWCNGCSDSTSVVLLLPAEVEAPGCCCEDSIIDLDDSIMCCAILPSGTLASTLTCGHQLNNF
jgi:hypothetical protein